MVNKTSSVATTRTPHVGSALVAAPFYSPADRGSQSPQIPYAAAVMSDTAALRFDFLAQLSASVRDGSFVKMTLGKPRGPDATLRNLFVRPVTLRGAPQLSFLWRHATQDLTKNFPPEDALAQIAALLGSTFHSAHLFTTARMAQLEFNKHGEPRLTYGKATGESAATTHDQPKHRLLPPESQRWLEKLGVTNSNGSVRTGMADKHRQIHKFVEILSHLVADALFPARPSGSDVGAQSRCALPENAPDIGRSKTAPLPLPATPDRPLEIADMGCGKGYLTFATHDYFNRIAHRAANVHGVETRPALVDNCNRVARDCGCANLHFSAGTIASAPFAALDVLIALHACDTATDDAIAKGLAAGATLIVVAPCCQKELRPQLTAAAATSAGASAVLAPALRHGIFQERHAEFATDALRALLLEWAGYDTKVFEFISTEHTAKNLMIAATKRLPGGRPGQTLAGQQTGTVRTEAAAAKVRELAAFYGVKTQTLARQLGFDLADVRQRK